MPCGVWLPGASENLSNILAGYFEIFYAVDDIQEIQLNDLVYFVVFEKAIHEYTDLGYEHPKLAYLEDQMKLIDLQKFGDLFIYKFGGSK